MLVMSLCLELCLTSVVGVGLDLDTDMALAMRMYLALTLDMNLDGTCVRSSNCTFTCAWT